jgi:NADH:ubiquinone reductase (H+-translocating)
MNANANSRLSMPTRTSRLVVVAGSGFAGPEGARSLARQALDILLVDRRNVHLFQPPIYQVAIGE